MAGGRRAALRQDFGAAAGLFERAVALLPPAEIDLALELDLVQALFDVGKGGEALQCAGSLAGRAVAAGDRVAELCGRIKEGVFRVYLEPEGATEQLAALVEHALPVFEAAANDLALYTACAALGQVATFHGQMDAALEAYERAATHARQAGQSEQLLDWRCLTRLNGTTPVSELLAWLDEQGEQAALNQWLRGNRATGLAMRGCFDEGRAILAEVRAELADRGGEISLAIILGHDSVDFELLAGDPAVAVELGEEGCRLFDELGEQSMLSTAAGKLGQALYALDRLEEADACASRAAEFGASDDALTQMLWRQVRAKVLARRGEHAVAERLAREAVAVGSETDMLNAQGDVYADLAEVLSIAGRPKEAAVALEQALERYERKGNLVMVGRTRDRLAAAASVT